MAKLVSKIYGEALFELAVEEKRIDVFQEEVQGVKSILDANKEFNELMKHPKVVKEEKIQIMENVFKGRITDEFLGFLTLIIEKDRYSDIDAILDYFIDKVKEEKGIGVAYVTTAITLTDVQKKQIEQKLLETTSYQEMEMHFTEDQALIGGMIIRIGDRVVDSSIATKLSELQRDLLKIQLA